MTKPLILIRADASAKNGGGHVMRCLNLVRELTDQGAQVRWACSRETLAVMPAVKAYDPIIVSDTDMENGKIFTAATQKAQADTIKSALPRVDAVIVDHYFLSAPFQSEMRGFAGKVVAIDEKIDRPHKADLIVDFLPHARREWDAMAGPEATILSGPAYKMLSPVFHEKAKERKRIKSAFNVARTKEKRVVITSGAVDGVNLIGRVLKTIAAEHGLKKGVRYDIPLFSSAPHIAEVRKQVASMQRRGFHIQLHENCSYVADLMKKADINIGSASAAAFEAGAIGGVAGIYYDCGHNQHRIGRLVGDKNGGYYMGHHSDFSPGLLRARLHQFLKVPALEESRRIQSGRLCDGRGARRVASRILHSTAAP